MTTFPDQIETNPIARELAELIRLEECNKNPDTSLESISDYDVYTKFIDIIAEFPELLEEVLEGQRAARDIDTYVPGAGILTFESTGHAQFLKKSLQCIKALLEFNSYSAGKIVYVNPINLKIFQFNYNKATSYTAPDQRDIFWTTLAEKLGVTDDLLREIQTYLDISDRNLGIQHTERVKREAQAAINPVSEA
jgi:hypothetical protein